MQKTLWILAGTLIFGSAAMADVVCPTGVNLTAYGAMGFTCHINNLDFSNFTFNSTADPAGLKIPATAITVNTLTDLLNEGFDFSTGMSVNNTVVGTGTNSFQDVKVGFTITTVDHSASIDDLYINFNGGFGGVRYAWIPGPWRHPSDRYRA